MPKDRADPRAQTPAMIQTLIAADKRQTLFRVAAALLAAGVGLPQAVAQLRAKLPLVGILDPGAPNAADPLIPAFKQALAGLGWVEGRTVAFETRYAEDRPELIASQVREMIGLKPDILFTHGRWAMVRIVARATATIPIVVMGGDLVEGGFAKSLARPGGNLTGMSMVSIETKQLEVLRDALPSVRRVGLLLRPPTPGTQAVALRVRESRNAAVQALGLEVQIVRVDARGEIPEAIGTLKKLGCEALLVADEPMLVEANQEVTALALQSRLPSLSQAPGFADAGGLLQFGTDVVQLFRSAAGHADRILRGAKPEDLPIEQPTKYELVVNLKTARALALKIPAKMLARADRIVE